jgi:hypothetical protein
MSDEIGLRRKAREAVRAGRVPAGAPEQMWGGPGSGNPCVICGLFLRHDEPELELQFAGEGDDREPDTYRFHVRCMAAWELERRAEEANGETVRTHGGGSPKSSSRGPSSALRRVGEDGIMTSCDEPGNDSARE